MSALAWQTIDLAADPDEAEHRGDPGDLIDSAAFVLELLKRPTWHAMAACRGMGTETFWPGRGESLDAARAICASCEVREVCLADALARGLKEDGGGVWGGTSQRERVSLRPRPGRQREAIGNDALRRLVATTPDLTWERRRQRWNLEHPGRAFATSTGMCSSWRRVVTQPAPGSDATVAAASTGSTLV
jgi:WhiB family redox-sensing transcriptional regulator